jgi:hypothetical protein
MEDKEARFTALLHHDDADRLGAAYRALNPRAATGIDGVTWETFGRDLERNLQDLLGRVHRGGYVASRPLTSLRSHRRFVRRLRRLRDPRRQRAGLIGHRATIRGPCG